MLLAIIPIESIPQALALMNQSSSADGFEFRLDYLQNIELEKVRYLQQQAKKPIVLTLRKPEQGGLYVGDETARIKIMQELISLHPEYMDIEYDVPLAVSQTLKAISPKTQLIVSYHNFKNTPSDLINILHQMINPIFSYYKIVTTAESVLDSLSVLQFVKKYAAEYPLVAHAMGEVGVVSRVLGKIMGNRLTYAAVDEKVIVKGLLTVNEFIEIYHYHQLNKQTQIYGLMGDPISQSIGHLFHNEAFIKHEQNAVYVKFQVTSEELPLFFKAIEDLPIQGLSVTMPHKEAVLPFCVNATAAVKRMGAANTLIKQVNGFLAANTDGDAVVSVLLQHTHIAHKKVAILGAGGAAISIIDSLVTASADVSVYNRTEEKLLPLIDKYAIKVISEKDLLTMDYDIVINTIPAKYYQKNIHFIPNKIVLDINYAENPTPLIQAALTNHCIAIDGYAMFYAQAHLQRKLWFI